MKDNANSVSSLLNGVSRIIEKHKKLQTMGAYFNIFEITGISSDEVTICKILYELINPHGRHYQGDIYLRLFVKTVLGLDFSEDDYKSARVFKEYVISNNRRIDLYIETDAYQIPIEVKLFASDQANQCYDYLKVALNSNVYYLTFRGDAPSEESAGDLNPNGKGYDGITQISFKNDIANWLDNCIKHPNTAGIIQIKEILSQLKTEIDILSGNYREGSFIMDITETIQSSSDNVSAAIEIANALLDVKANITINFFRELKKLFENAGRTTFNYNDDEILAYYVTNRRCYPCITIEIKRFPNNITAALCIEIGDMLYYDFAFFKMNRKGGYSDYIGQEKVKKLNPDAYNSFCNAINTVTKGNGKSSDVSIFWDYLYDAEGRKYNFKHFSPACVDLSENYKSHAQRIFNKLNGYIDILR